MSKEWVVAVEPEARAARLAGEFDAANVEVVRAALATLAAFDDASGPVRLDLEAVDFCSAALLSCLLELRDRTREHGTSIQIVRASARVRWLLEFTNTADSFELFPPGP